MLAKPSAIHQAGQRLNEGGLVAFPTETVYGLGANALDAHAVARVFALKGRPSRNPLIVHVADEAMAKSLTTEWPEAAQKLAKALWPGPLSLILPKAAHIPDIVTGGGPNVALRCPDHALTLELLRQFGKPLVGPSANPSGSISPTKAAHVSAAFSPEDVFVLDGGSCRGGIESTVLLLTEHPPRILRPGLISAEQIGSVLKGPVADFIPGIAQRESAHDVSPLQSPGTLARHYAPTTKAVLIDSTAVKGLLADATSPVVVISHEPVRVNPPHRLEPLPHDAKGYAAGLYAALRSADDGKASLIAIVKPTINDEHKALWLAILDRLSRATS
ncbi:MAG: L-threonylcarbamoyladenylate synthase [Phycisphaerales bacterium]